jgi:uncharacterized phage-associated protein
MTVHPFYYNRVVTLVCVRIRRVLIRFRGNQYVACWRFEPIRCSLFSQIVPTGRNTIDDIKIKKRADGMKKQEQRESKTESHRMT